MQAHSLDWVTAAVFSPVYLVAHNERFGIRLSQVNDLDVGNGAYLYLSPEALVEATANTTAVSPAWSHPGYTVAAPDGPREEQQEANNAPHRPHAAVAVAAVRRARCAPQPTAHADTSAAATAAAATAATAEDAWAFACCVCAMLDGTRPWCFLTSQCPPPPDELAVVATVGLRAPFHLQLGGEDSSDPTNTSHKPCMLNYTPLQCAGVSAARMRRVAAVLRQCLSHQPRERPTATTLCAALASRTPSPRACAEREVEMQLGPHHRIMSYDDVADEYEVSAPLSARRPPVYGRRQRSTHHQYQTYQWYMQVVVLGVLVPACVPQQRRLSHLKCRGVALNTRRRRRRRWTPSSR